MSGDNHNQAGKLRCGCGGFFEIVTERGLMRMVCGTCLACVGSDAARGETTS